MWFALFILGRGGFLESAWGSRNFLMEGLR